MGNLASMKWQVWQEGAVTMEGHYPHYLLAEIEAGTFDEACQKLSNMPEHKQWMRQSNTHWYYWGCRLFDNRGDAARNFG